MTLSSYFVIALVLSFISGKAYSVVPATLPELLQFALNNNSVLPEQRTQLISLSADKSVADSPLFNNPGLEFSGGKRRDTAGNPERVRQNEWGMGISQTFEIAGQQGHRQEVARTSLNGLQDGLLDSRNQVLLTTADLWYRMLAQQEKIALEVRAVELYTRVERAISRQREAGSATRLENNLATVERELAANQLLVAQQALEDTRTELARFLLTPVDAIPPMQGSLDSGLNALPYTLDTLSARLSDTPKLRAMVWQEKSAAAALDLQKAARIPDVTFGVNYSQDGPDSGREDLYMLSLSVPLPVFQNNEGGIGGAASELARTRIALQQLRNDQQQILKNQWLRLTSLKKRVEILNQQVLPATQMNQRLTQLAQDNGQTSLTDVLLTNQQILNAQRTRLDTLLEYHATRLALEYTTNWNGREIP